MRDTSIISYKQEVDKGLGLKQQQVYDVIKELISPTDREIALELHFFESDDRQRKRSAEWQYRYN